MFVGTREKFIMIADEEKKAGMDVKSFICQPKKFGFYSVDNWKPREPYEAKNVAKHVSVRTRLSPTGGLGGGGLTA